MTSMAKRLKTRYEQYEQMARDGELKLHKTLKAQSLWRKMLGMIFETGHPWMTFKDPCNLRSPQQHCGVVHSSNLCTEITLNTNAEEIAVCNLGSVNLPQHIEDGELNLVKLRSTVRRQSVCSIMSSILTITRCRKRRPLTSVTAPLAWA